MNTRKPIRALHFIKMATEALRAENPDSMEALTREAETLKAKLEDEKAKLNDVDSMFIFWTQIYYLRI